MMPAWPASTAWRRTKCARFNVTSTRCCRVANRSTSSSVVARPPRPLSWTVMTSCPSRRSSSAAGSGKFSFVYSDATTPPPSGRFVGLDLPFDFGRVGVPVCPGFHEILGTERRIGPQQICFSRSQPPRLHQKPDGDPRAHDARADLFHSLLALDLRHATTPGKAGRSVGRRR